MKPGTHVLLQRGKKRYQVKVISDHTATFPAITVEHRGDPWIVGINEIVTQEQVQKEADAKRAEEEASVKDVVDAFRAGNVTFRAIADALGKQMVDVISRCRKAERLGLIKLNRHKHENKITTSTSNQPEQVPDL